MGSMEIEAGELTLGPGGIIDEKVVWMATDCDDPSAPLTADPAQLYNFDAVAYESIMLGLFQLHNGSHNNVCSDAGLSLQWIAI